MSCLRLCIVYKITYFPVKELKIRISKRIKKRRFSSELLRSVYKCTIFNQTFIAFCNTFEQYFMLRFMNVFVIGRYWRYCKSSIITDLMFIMDIHFPHVSSIVLYNVIVGYDNIIEAGKFFFFDSVKLKKKKKRLR